MLRFVDSFSHYTQEFMAKKWDVCNFGSGSNTMAQSLTSGRFGAGGVTFAGAEAGSGPVNQYCQKNWEGGSTVYVGMALKQTATQINGNPNMGSGARWLSFLDGATLQVGLQLLESGQIRAIRNITAGDGYYLEILPNPKCTVLGTSS